MKDFEHIVAALKESGVPESDAFYWASDWETHIKRIPVGSSVMLLGKDSKPTFIGKTADGAYYDDPRSPHFNIVESDESISGVSQWKVEKVILESERQHWETHTESTLFKRSP